MPTNKNSVTIEIKGVQFKEGDKFLDISITHDYNEHARAEVIMRFSKETGKKFMKEVDTTKTVKISAKEIDPANPANPPKDNVLFFGYITDAATRPRGAFLVLRLKLIGTSFLLDLKKGSQSFQKLDAKYEEILKKVYSGEEGDAKSTTLQMEDGDKSKTIEKMILRLDETAWEFTKRMASHLNRQIFTDITAEKPALSVGVPKPNQTIEIEENDLSVYNISLLDFKRSSENPIEGATAPVKEDFLDITYDSQKYLRIGDVLKVGSKNYIVSHVEMEVFRENLITHVKVHTKNFFTTPKFSNENVTGRILRAQVQKVEKDTVQAHLIEIDKEYDSSGTMKFPFATVYSSSDGSGWYVMPEEKDYVWILLPTDDEGDAFAFSGVNTTPLKDPKQKSFRAPDGKEIIMTDKSLELICEHQKIFTALFKDKGIFLASSKDIKLAADGNISMAAKGKIAIAAKSEMEIKCGSSKINLKSMEVSMGGSQIVVGD